MTSNILSLVGKKKTYTSIASFYNKKIRLYLTSAVLQNDNLADGNTQKDIKGKNIIRKCNRFINVNVSFFVQSIFVLEMLAVI